MEFTSQGATYWPSATRVATMAGVTAVDQPAGSVEVTLQAEGDSILDLTVDDGDSHCATVHLSYDMAVSVLLALAERIARL